MRRSLLGLLTVVAMAGLLLTASCERANVLRVVSINKGNSLRVDIADFFQYFDKIDSDYVTLYQYMPESVEVVLQYVEIGAGLPTWTPYQACVNKASITFRSNMPGGDEPPVYNKVTIPLNQAVMADAAGKTTTTFFMTCIPAVWKQTTFVDFFLEPPDYDIVDLADATFTFTGYDSLANRDVRAVGTLQVEFGNFYDDLSRFGK
jgi:hypothetical protein